MNPPASERVALGFVDLDFQGFLCKGALDLSKWKKSMRFDILQTKDAMPGSDSYVAFGRSWGLVKGHRQKALRKARLSPRFQSETIGLCQLGPKDQPEIHPS